MKSNRNIVYFFRNFNTKHRLSLRKEHNDTEVWYMHISPLEFIGGIIASLLIVFIIVLLLVVYTPVLNLVPGYQGNRSHELMIQNIMRVDSIERRLNEIQIYTSDVSLIMEGKTPITRIQTSTGDSVVISQQDIIPASETDSILRSQMEGSGIYSLSHTAFGRNSGGMELIAPVKGIVATHFNPKEDRYGVGIATASSQQILAVTMGTVTLSSWSPGSGYTIQIQHNNLISIYKNCTRTLHPIGSRVRSGEVIGYTAEGVSGEDGKGFLEIELWQNGTPLDPETHIIF